MPAGPMPLGFAYFVATKFAGYTAFCRWGIEPWIGRSTSSGSTAASATIPSAWKASAARTLIGVSIGAVVGLAFWRILFFGRHAQIEEFLFFGLLIPIRVFEWWLLLHWIYKSTPLSNRARFVLILVGIIVSFMFDVIGIMAAFVIPGGMWVC